MVSPALIASELCQKTLMNATLTTLLIITRWSDVSHKISIVSIPALWSVEIEPPAIYT